MRWWIATSLFAFTMIACSSSSVQAPEDATWEQNAADGGVEAAAASVEAPKPFTLVVVPDTQVQVYKWPDDYYKQMKWIADNVQSLGIQYVIHVGDIIEGCVYGLSEAQIEDQWKRAKKGTDFLEGKVPYIMTIGNHDFDGWGTPCDPSNTDFGAGITKTNRVATKFNKYYPRSLFASRPTFGGTFPDDLNDNSFHVFRAGGTDWLVLTLKYQPTDAELDWASEVVATHPDHHVIIDTHSYLSGNGQRSPDGDRIWEKVGKRYPNVSFILSGHINSKRRTATGDAGNTVHEIMSDYQTYKDRPRNSYLRLMTFDPAAKTVSVRTYSPTLNKDNATASDDDKFVLSGVEF
jgi:hypothetical protein